jgi:FRG domain
LLLPLQTIDLILSGNSQDIRLHGNWNITCQLGRFFQSNHRSVRFYFRGQKDFSWDLAPNVGRPDVCGAGGYFLADEMNLFSQFKDDAVEYHSQYLETIEWLAIAQHHGLPTRLLDWSTNPLTAAWFACSDERSTTDAAVHMIRVLNSDIEKRRDFNPFDKNLTDMILVKVPPRAARITAQQGLFTSHAEPQKQWSYSGANATKGIADYLKFQIPHADQAFFRRLLNILGVNQARLMKDLQSLCSTLAYNYRNR